MKMAGPKRRHSLDNLEIEVGMALYSHAADLKNSVVRLPLLRHFD